MASGFEGGEKDRWYGPGYEGEEDRKKRLHNERHGEPPLEQRKTPVANPPRREQRVRERPRK